MPTYPPTSEPTTSVSSPVTSSLLPPIPVPTHGSGGTFSVLAKTRIAAPPKKVLDVIRNTNTWHEWNTFCPRCVITSSPVQDSTGQDQGLERGKGGWLEVGTVANIEVFMSGEGLVEGKKKSRDQGIVITVLEAIEEDGRKGWRIAWKSTGWSHWQLHSERVMEFVETDGGGTEYDCWETFGGLLGSTVKATVGTTLVDRFGDYARDVKRVFEGRKNRNANGST